MTDRVNALIIVLEKDVRDDDIEGLVLAIRQLRGVLRVEPNISGGIDQYVGVTRVKEQIRQRLYKILGELHDLGGDS